jgi:hypothetical protein
MRGRQSLALLTGVRLQCAGTPSAGRLGKFLVQAQFQGSVHSSALFLTAAAQNLLCMKLASELGVAIPSPWVTWFKGALAPALLGLLVTPLIMFKVWGLTLLTSPCPVTGVDRLSYLGSACWKCDVAQECLPWCTHIASSLMAGSSAYGGATSSQSLLNQETVMGRPPPCGSYRSWSNLSAFLEMGILKGVVGDEVVPNQAGACRSWFPRRSRTHRRRRGRPS